MSDGAVWCNLAATQIIIEQGIRTPCTHNGVWHRICSHLSAAKPKYTFDFSEEEGDEEENGDDDAASSPVRSFKDDFSFSDNKDRYDDHNDEEEDEDNEDSYSPAKQKTT